MIMAKRKCGKHRGSWYRGKGKIRSPLLLRYDYTICRTCHLLLLLFVFLFFLELKHEVKFPKFLSFSHANSLLDDLCETIAEYLPLPLPSPAFHSVSFSGLGDG